MSGAELQIELSAWDSHVGELLFLTFDHSWLQPSWLQRIDLYNRRQRQIAQDPMVFHKSAARRSASFFTDGRVHRRPVTREQNQRIAKCPNRISNCHLRSSPKTCTSP